MRGDELHREEKVETEEEGNEEEEEEEERRKYGYYLKLQSFLTSFSIGSSLASMLA